MPGPSDLPRELGDFAQRAERDIGHLAKRAERDVGHFIRELRNNARISLRELADRAGVSNPYLSQIERGLRRPSAEVLAQLADALRVSTALMYLRAGLLPDSQGHSVLGAIAADTDLTVAQKQSLTQLYEAFRRENGRAGGDEAPRVENGKGATPGPTTRPGRRTASSGRGRTNHREEHP